MIRFLFVTLFIVVLSFGACQCSDKPEQSPVEETQM